MHCTGTLLSSYLGFPVFSIFHTMIAVSTVCLGSPSLDDIALPPYPFYPFHNLICFIYLCIFILAPKRPKAKSTNMLLTIQIYLFTSLYMSLSLPSCFLPGNYYGTPRPVHIGPESPPITYQEHRNLLRNFRTRSKSLSNLEKAAEEGENSEDDSGLSGRFTKDRLSRKAIWVTNLLQSYSGNK
jgi:hypothetical protein